MIINEEQRSIVTGMGGWDLFPFQGRFYPSRMPKGFRKLAFYSKYFDMIEVNATFYNTDFGPFHVRRWLEDVQENDHFTFTVKLFRGYTHSYDATRSDLQRIYRMLDAFQESGRLGGVLLQFPGSLKNRKECRDYLYRLSHAFRRYRMFLELRHGSWDSPLMHNFFQENRYHLVNVDLPAVNDHVAFRSLGWDGAAYFRMMGRNAGAWNAPWRLEPDGRHMVSDRYAYRYSDAELRSLAASVRTLDPAQARTVYVVFHNDPQAQSIANGLQLRHLLAPERPLAIPPTTLRAFPALREISASTASWAGRPEEEREPMLAL
jgi:uncharacterized protein YecE (DUF72 family)